MRATGRCPERCQDSCPAIIHMPVSRRNAAMSVPVKNRRSQWLSLRGTCVPRPVRHRPCACRPSPATHGCAAMCAGCWVREGVCLRGRWHGWRLLALADHRRSHVFKGEPYVLTRKRSRRTPCQMVALRTMMPLLASCCLAGSGSGAAWLPSARGLFATRLQPPRAVAADPTRCCRSSGSSA